MPDTKTTLKLIGAGVLLAVGMGFVYSQYAGMTAARASQGPPAPGNRPPGAPPGLVMPTQEERASMREEIFAKLNLTPAQREQMEEIRQKFGDLEPGQGNFNERREAVEKVLSPEQMDGLRTEMQRQVRGRMEQAIKVLPADQQELFRQKLDKRMQELAAREDFPGPPPGFGPATPPAEAPRP